MEAPTVEPKRIPLVKKRAPTAEIMDLKEIEEKMKQYCQLWVLYTQASCELTRRSKILQDEAAKVCIVYRPYIRDVLQQVDEVMTLFVMEKELRNIKGRGHFPIPTITPHDTKIENSQQSRKTLEAVDKELIRILNAVKESEYTYKREQEAARQQARAARSTHRTEYNFTRLNSSTPIKNTGTTENRRQPPERTTHFNPNPTHHFYPPTEMTGHTNWYEPPINDLIINGAGTTPGVQFTIGTTDAAGHNEPWRSNGTGTAPQQHYLPPCTSNLTDGNGLFSDSLSSSNNRNGPTCFKCGEQGHMRHECTNRVFCSHCKSGGHCDRKCRKLRNNTPSPTNSHIPTGYHPTVTPPPLNAPTTTANAAAQPHTTMDFGSRITKTPTTLGPAPQYTHCP